LLGLSFFDTGTSLEISFNFLLEVKNITVSARIADPNIPTMKEKIFSVKKTKELQKTQFNQLVKKFT
jgi:hypothetical protein